MDTKVCFIIPYFGKLPKGFQVYLNTCGNNPEFDFLLFTNDRSSYNYPKNVHVTYMEFIELKEMFQKHFDFKISLERPYKLCDYKAAYGDIFQDYIGKYDFWGHCDIDLLWGKISHFYNDELFKVHDHLGFEGHCQLFRNTKRINRLYRIIDKEIDCDYVEVYSNDKSYGFDERPLNRIFKKYCDKNYYKINFANLNKYDYAFHLSNYIPEDDYKNKHQIFEYKDSMILRHYVYKNQIFTEEFCYLHLWCRPITFKVKNKNSCHYFIYPEVVTDKNIGKLTIRKIKRKNRKNFFRYYFKSLWYNRKKLTFKRIIFNIKGMLKYKRRKKDVRKNR